MVIRLMEDRLQVHEMTIGWPLGLDNMIMRLRVGESLQATVAAEPYSLHIQSSSFSSFSSSNLDTESTASFFHDHSVSLGRLIGIGPGDRGELFFPNTMRIEENERASLSNSSSNEPSPISDGHRKDVSQGICIPLLFSVLVKVSRSKSNSSR